MSEQRDGTFLGAVGWTIVLVVVIAVVGFIGILLTQSPSPPGGPGPQIVPIYTQAGCQQSGGTWTLLPPDVGDTGPPQWACYK